MDTAVDGIEDIVSAVERHRAEQLLLLIGFDGVLASYSGDPDAVRLSSRRRSLLRQIARRADVTVGIVSGRRVADLRCRTGLGDRVFYVGLHGLEVEGPGFNRVDHETLGSCQRQLHDIASRLEGALAPVPGVRIEDKGPAIAVHTREAGPVDAVWARIRLLNVATDLVSHHAVRVVRGNHVFELVPNVEGAKAGAIAALREHLQRHHERGVFVMYLGEDVVEDDVLDAVEDGGLAAVVGRRSRRASYHLDSPAVVERLIVAVDRRRLPLRDGRADRSRVSASRPERL